VPAGDLPQMEVVFKKQTSQWELRDDLYKQTNLMTTYMTDLMTRIADLQTLIDAHEEPHKKYAIVADSTQITCTYPDLDGGLFASLREALQQTECCGKGLLDDAVRVKDLIELVSLTFGIEDGQFLLIMDVLASYGFVFVSDLCKFVSAAPSDVDSFQLVFTVGKKRGRRTMDPTPDELCGTIVALNGLRRETVYYVYEWRN